VLVSFDFLCVSASLAGVAFPPAARFQLIDRRSLLCVRFFCLWCLDRVQTLRLPDVPEKYRNYKYLLVIIGRIYQFIRAMVFCAVGHRGFRETIPSQPSAVRELDAGSGLGFSLR